MPRKPHKRPVPPTPQDDPDSGPGTVRIVGGTFRGRKLRYSGDLRTRPMKDRVREAVFNLVSVAVKGSHAVDLFAGTGALGLEALSRGAARATLIECHFPTVALIRENVAQLEVADRANVVGSDAFYWVNQRPQLGDAPWTVFISPPFDFFVERREDMLQAIRYFIDEAPLGSAVVVESDQRFDPDELPYPEIWDVREYHPALVAIYHKRRATVADAPQDDTSN